MYNPVHFSFYHFPQSWQAMKIYPHVSGSNSRILLSAGMAQHLSEAANAHYRNLAEYDETVLPVLLKLQYVNWQLVRELVIGQWKQVEAESRRAFFDRQNGPDYLAARYDKRRGAYPSRVVYLPHEFYPVRGWCPLALDKTRRVAAGTFDPRPRPEVRLVRAEQEGYEYLENLRLSNPDARAEVGARLLRTAQILSQSAALKILLETGAPQLKQLTSGAGNALGYVSYFFDRWHEFHEYELAAPAPSQPTTPPAALLPVQDSDVEKRLAYFDKLLADCRRAEHPHDTAQLLRAAYEEQASRGVYDLEDFMERLPTYVLAKLPSESRGKLESSILRSLRGRLRIFRLRPETWPVWAVAQRELLLERQQDVGERLALAESGGRAESEMNAVASWRDKHGKEAATAVARAQQKKLVADVTTHRATLTHLTRILEALDIAKAAGRGEVRASELDGAAETAPPEPAATLATPSPTAGPFAPLLLNYTLAELTALLRELGLLDPSTGFPTPAASPGAWVGVVHALLDPKRPRLRKNMAATRRALAAAFGAQVSESALQAGISKRGSESEQFRDRTLALLSAPATGD